LANASGPASSTNRAPSRTTWSSSSMTCVGGIDLNPPAITNVGQVGKPFCVAGFVCHPKV